LISPTLIKGNQTVPRGGKREGSGRKAGAVTQRTREIAEKAHELGITPLEVMLDNMRFAHSEVGKLMKVVKDADAVDGDVMRGIIEMRDAAQKYAADAAPFVHARLAAVEVQADVKVSVEDEILADLNGRNGDARPDAVGVRVLRPASFKGVLARGVIVALEMLAVVGPCVRSLLVAHCILPSARLLIRPS
jgi:hypothetical protein